MCKVYVGSFSTGPIRNDINPYGPELFQKEQEDLLTDLYEIPHRACDRKVRQDVQRLCAQPYAGQRVCQARARL